jgi:hypothetical protein
MSRYASLIVCLALGMSVAAAEPSAAPLISEAFESADLPARGWYDGKAVRLAGDAAAGSGCMEYEWVSGQDRAQGSSTVRHLFAATDRVAIRFYLKLSQGWGWSGRPFHPHLVQFLTTANGAWDGPAATHLTLYVEPVGGRLRLAAQDIQNQTAPHGLTQGAIKGGFNGTMFDSADPVFDDADWHCVEAYFQLNTLDAANDRPNADGIVRGWFDDRLVVDRSDVVLRTTDYADMRMNQVLIAPHFGPGLVPHPQKLWIDEFAVGIERIGPSGSVRPQQKP